MNHQLNVTDEVLMQVAKERVQFKKQLVSYLLVNAFLWVLWFSGYMGYHKILLLKVPTPAIVMFFWGIALVLNFIKTYFINTTTLIQKEYNQLKNK